MKNKLFWVGMLVMVLAFGMMVVGCDNGDNDNGNNNNGGNDNGNNNNSDDIINPFVGTWRDSDYGTTFKFYTDGTFVYSVVTTLIGGTYTYRGTYTYGGNSAILSLEGVFFCTLTIIDGKFVYSTLIYTKQQ